MQPRDIPATSPERYVSFMHALNLRFPDEDTGDWHFLGAFFGMNGDFRAVPLAGRGEAIDTTPALGTLGVRDMSSVLFEEEVIAAPIPVYAANHYRAIADMVYNDFVKGISPGVATVREINAWLDTQEQVDTLRRDYLGPLSDLFEGETKERFEEWCKEVVFS